MAKKNNTVLYIALAAAALVGFTMLKKKRGKVDVSETEKISEDEFNEAKDLQPKNDVSNVVTEAAANTSNRIESFANEVTSTVDQVQQAAEKIKEAGGGAVLKLKEKLKKVAAKKKAEKAIRDQRRKAPMAARKARKKRRIKLARKKKALFGVGEIEII